jgi:hypothetical protein
MPKTSVPIGNLDEADGESHGYTAATVPEKSWPGIV